MNKMLVVDFKSEAAAYAGVREFGSFHAGGATGVGIAAGGPAARLKPAPSADDHLIAKLRQVWKLANDPLFG